MAAPQCARGSNGFDGVYCTLLDLRIYSMTLVVLLDRLCIFFNDFFMIKIPIISKIWIQQAPQFAKSSGGFSPKGT